MNRRRPMPRATARPGTVRGGKKIINVAPNPSAYADRVIQNPIPSQTRRQRKKTGRKTSTAAVTGAGGQNRTVAVGKRAAPTNKTAAAKKTRKPLTRAASRRRERAIERTAQQQQRVQQRAQRRAANQARRAANRQARVARRTR